MHPPLYPFENAERWKSFLTHALSWNEENLRIADQLLSKNIIPIAEGSEIGTYLGVSKKLIWAMALNPSRYYREFTIRKKAGGVRSICAPRVFLKTVQRYILNCILNPIPVHDAAHGFVINRSPISGAHKHRGARFLWNIDLKDFFPSIDRQKIVNEFLKLGYPPLAAYALGSLCCLNGRLPQGAPTSPALANRVFLSADENIAKACSDRGIVYTRYADDLSFSSQSPIDSDFRSLILELVSEAGFSINERKTRLMGPRCRLEVTGLTVNNGVSIPRKLRRGLRAKFHQVKLEPHRFIGEKNKLQGYAAWVADVHASEGASYLAIVETIPETQAR